VSRRFYLYEKSKASEVAEAVKSKIFRLFGREKHVHRLLGAGKRMRSFFFVSKYCAFFVMLHTVPFLYDKYEDQVDLFEEKVTVEFKKHYAVLQTKCLSKIPRGPQKDKKFE
ncbi:hypothetical protein GW17_00050325, partial [Ensete ventricosum]